jgi:hypothetical protein
MGQTFLLYAAEHRNTRIGNSFSPLDESTLIPMIMDLDGHHYRGQQ